MIKIELTPSEVRALLQVIESQQKIALQRRDTAQENNTKLLYEMLYNGLDNIANKILVACKND